MRSTEWERAKRRFQGLPPQLRKRLTEQACHLIHRILETELQRYKGKMRTPPIHFSPDLGIAETFIIVKNPKTKETLSGIGTDVSILVYQRERWTKDSEAKIKEWAQVVAIALAGHPGKAGAERFTTERKKDDSRMKHAHFDSLTTDLPLERIRRAYANFLSLVDPRWLAREEGKYPGPTILYGKQDESFASSLQKDRHLPSAGPFAVALLTHFPHTPLF